MKPKLYMRNGWWVCGLSGPVYDWGRYQDRTPQLAYAGWLRAYTPA